MSEGGGFFGSQVSAIGTLVQVFRFGYRSRVLSQNLNPNPYLNL
jgi:hypothetical protein